MSSRELTEWIAFYQLYPPPDPYGHTALICSTVANLLGKRRTAPGDFDPRPDWSATDAGDALRIQEAKFSLFAAAHNSREVFLNGPDRLD